MSGPSCVQKAILCWVLTLAAILVYYNGTLLPRSKGEASQGIQENPEKKDAAATDARFLEIAKAKQPVNSEDFENNAPWPGPRAGETQERSVVADVMPDADGLHQHGRIGLLPDGSPRYKPDEWPANGLSDEDRRDAHRGFCFNSRKSDSISVDRDQPEARSRKCVAKHKEYPLDLPSASVVIVFHNENYSILIRSLHSVLNHSPPRLLKEIILVDDASVPTEGRFYEKHWRRLQDELADYCRNLPKVTLVRLKERRGLMMARMEGVWRASGEVAVFLDSHIEATQGWIEPLLARIKEDKGHVVVPQIDGIDAESFIYAPGGGGLSILSFSWTLGQDAKPAPGGDSTMPAKSPVMAGGLFASDRKMFLKLGGYDPEMRLYGGEEMEIGFRTWMCGGDIEWVPCSHVGHVFRTPLYWQGQVYVVPGEEIARNKLRTAEVWMDDYKRLVQLATSPLPKSLPLGDVSARVDLRRRLQCKSFDWYIKNVVPDLYVPKLGPNAVSGSLRNEAFGACIDTLGSKNSGEAMGVYPCHGQHGSQALVLDGDGLMLIPAAGYKNCMAAQSGKIVVQSCDKSMQRNVWEYDRQKLLFISKLDNSCLQASRDANDKSPYTLLLQDAQESPLRDGRGWTDGLG
eukprot:CAMPEP_0170614212 /NCGR_PEP_ID=MMETSP0224-20130122/24680_1 /TAXON_ID=285029 /ORGANISM="Togula jolla, Strain CCCM 725" /LENGTH=630 /DNA_ID=CAMNT_0010939855 /DNA_START=22 /DNA_END=1915 /DNA_ORIENTATION=+